MRTGSKEVGDQEMKSVIADFLDMGHVENIVAMFRQDSRYYTWSGELLQDERFSVRLGVSVLFEELKEIQSDTVGLAIPSLVKLLDSEEPLYRGEAVSILGIIGGHDALAPVRQLKNDPSSQVREMVDMVLTE